MGAGPCNLPGHMVDGVVQQRPHRVQLYQLQVVQLGVLQAGLHEVVDGLAELRLPENGLKLF